MLARRFLTSERLLLSVDCVKHVVIRYDRFKVPDLGAGQVLLKLVASPFNLEDRRILYGKYQIQLPPFPFCLGSEGCFRVEDIGPDVKNYERGDMVFVLPELSQDSPNCIGYFGCWTRHAVILADYLYKLPGGLSIPQAASIKVNPVTALCILSSFVTLNKGDFVIQNGANHYLGQCIIQLCAAKGYKTINIIDNVPQSDKVKDDLIRMGADYVFTVKEASVKIKEMNYLRNKIKLGLDVMGGHFTLPVFHGLSDGGTVVAVDAMSLKAPSINAQTLVYGEKTFTGFWFTLWVKNNREKYIELLHEAVECVQCGRLKGPLRVSYYTLNEYGKLFLQANSYDPTATRMFIY